MTMTTGRVDQGSPLLQAALAYATRGWPVLPVHTPMAGGCSCRRPGCAKPGKHRAPRTASPTPPPTARGSQPGGPAGQTPTSRSSPATWSSSTSTAPTGAPRLSRSSATTSRCPRRCTPHPQGEHLYFTAPDNTIPCSVGRLGRGLDVRGHGGYAIAPPSHHHQGQRYRWTHHAPAAPLPTWLAALLTPPAVPERSAAPPSPPLAGCSRSQRYLHAALAGELADVAGAQPGTRNHTLNRAAFRLGQLAASGLATLDELAPQLLDAARHAGLPDSEATATIASGLTAGHQHPRPREVPR